MNKVKLAFKKGQPNLWSKVKSTQLRNLEEKKPRIILSIKGSLLLNSLRKC